MEARPWRGVGREIAPNVVGFRRSIAVLERRLHAMVRFGMLVAGGCFEWCRTLVRALTWLGRWELNRCVDGNRPLGGSDLGRSSGGDRGGVLLRLQV